MRLKCVVAYLRYVRVINVCKEDWNFQHVQYVDKYSNCIYIFTTYVLVIIIIREPCEVLIYVEYVQQATPRTKKLSEFDLEDSILRREFDLGRNGEFDDGDGPSTEPNDMIEDQLLEDYFNEVDKISVTCDGESKYEVGLDEK